jgi:hypothetical protein
MKCAKLRERLIQVGAVGVGWDTRKSEIQFFFLERSRPRLFAHKGES